MAKRRGNKTKAIQAVLSENPKATPKEIAAALKSRRIRVSAALISRVKYGKTNGTVSGVAFDHLLAAKGLVAKLGSLEAAKSALDSLAKLIEA